MRWFILAASLAAVALGLTPPALAAINSLPTPVLLNILWRVKIGSDYTTTTDAGERENFPSDGAIYYIPSSNIANTVPFYRLRNSSGTDHMDSLYAGEGGYITEGLHGYAYSGSTVASGITQLYRYRKGGDHALGRPDEGGYFAGLGYSLDGPHAGWAYPRYGNAGTSLLPLTAGGVTIESNAVAGGSLWRWTWNGLQFVNGHDYGREIQSALFYENGSILYNPTEAGDEYTGPSYSNEEKHGSPLVQFTNSGTTQMTRGVPLEYIPSYFGGGVNHPVIYNDIREMGKNITLNYNNMGPVARYDTRWYLPGPLSTANNPFIEIPTGYLRGMFNRYYTYDAVPGSLGTLTEVFPGQCDPYNPINFQTNYGGVIISDATGAYAMGVYGVHNSVGGPVTRFQLFDFVCGGGNGSGDYNTSKWSAMYYHLPLPAGYIQTTTWIASGSLAQVRQAMHDLYMTGPSSNSGPIHPASAGERQNVVQLGSDQPGVMTSAKGIMTRTWVGMDPDQQRHQTARRAK
jgi:hypothetical protein